MFVKPLLYFYEDFHEEYLLSPPRDTSLGALRTVPMRRHVEASPWTSPRYPSISGGMPILPAAFKKLKWLNDWKTLMSMKALLSGWRFFWCWQMMVWSTQMKSATSSLVRNTFRWVFHGRVASHNAARILWLHLMTMSEMVIGRCFLGDVVPASLAIATSSHGGGQQAGSPKAAKHWSEPPAPQAEVLQVTKGPSIWSRSPIRHLFYGVDVLHRNGCDNGPLHGSFEQRLSLITRWW